MKILTLFLIASVCAFAQNTGGGSSGGGGGGPVTFTTPYPVTTAQDSSNNPVSLLTNTTRVLPFGNGSALADGVANLINKSTAIGTANYYPLSIVPSLFNGSTWDRQFYCNVTAAGTVTASGATQILPIVAASSYRICAFRASTTPAVALQITQGTGTNCATGSAALSLALLGVTNVVFEPGPGAAYKGTSANAVCITLGAAQTVNYDISYTVF